MSELSVRALLCAQHAKQVVSGFLQTGSTKSLVSYRSLFGGAVWVSCSLKSLSALVFECCLRAFGSALSLCLCLVLVVFCHQQDLAYLANVEGTRSPVRLWSEILPVFFELVGFLE